LDGVSGLIGEGRGGDDGFTVPGRLVEAVKGSGRGFSVVVSAIVLWVGLVFIFEMLLVDKDCIWSHE